MNQCRNIGLFLVTGAALLTLAVAPARAQTPATSFEDVTREDTVAAYMSFIAANPKERNTTKAYRLLSGALYKELRVSERQSRSGTIDCRVITTLVEMAGLFRIARTNRLSFKCTAYKHVQRFTNRTKYPLIVRKFQRKDRSYKTIIVKPRKSYTRTEKLKGEGCLTRPRIVRRGSTGHCTHSCPKKPTLRKRFIDSVVPVHPAALTEYENILRQRSSSAAQAFIDARPHNPLNAPLNDHIKTWLAEGQKLAAGAITLKHKYTKRPSRAFPNPYNLLLKNRKNVPIQATVSIEYFEHWVFVPPKATVTIAAVTRKGSKPNYKMTQASLQVTPLPYALKAGPLILKFGDLRFFSVRRRPAPDNQGTFSWDYLQPGRARHGIAWASSKYRDRQLSTGREIKFSISLDGASRLTGSTYLLFEKGKWFLSSYGYRGRAEVRSDSYLDKAAYEALMARQR